MITCRELAETLFDFVAGSLPPDRKGHVEHHLGQCPACRVYHETYLLTIRLSRKLPPHPLPPQLAQRLRAILDDPGTRPAAPPGA